MKLANRISGAMILVAFGLYFLVSQSKGVIRSIKDPCDSVAKVQAIKDDPKKPKFVRGSCPENMVFIPAGSFMAGKEGDEKNPPTKMELKSYCIDQYVVSNTEYNCTMKEKNKNLETDFFGEADWFEARDYCEKVGKRLPTEWEWEKAAKGGTDTNFFWGDNPIEAKEYGHLCHFHKDKYGRCGTREKLTHFPIGSYLPNPYGLYDVVGGVREWTDGFYKNTRNGDEIASELLDLSSPTIKELKGDWRKREDRFNLWYRTVSRGSNVFDFRIQKETGLVKDKFLHSYRTFVSVDSFRSGEPKARWRDPQRVVGIRCAKSL